MSETKYELPAWCNGLIIFLFTPALLFVIVSAFVVLALMIAIVFIMNFPIAIWCAITGREFKYKFAPQIKKQNKEKSRE